MKVQLNAGFSVPLEHIDSPQSDLNWCNNPIVLPILGNFK